MTFKLGANSLQELHNVHPDLVGVVNRAILISIVDFAVHDGLRTLDEQKEYVKTGASQTLKSLHLPQADTGYGHAVDLVPVINGKLRWEWGPIYHIAAAMHHASRELGVNLIWGGVWDRPFSELGDTAADLEHEVEAYTARRRQIGKKAFLDGPHYQIA
ncbi:M15 family metallopeptidase [Rhizobium sp. SGZ-381]|nr:M15 family metallopeptidase [Neorhizobium galegae]